MRRILVILTLIAGTALAAVPASATPQAAGKTVRSAATPVLLSPYWIGRCRHGVHHLTRPGSFQLGLSEFHGCNASGPGSYITMSRWARWNSRDAYGFGWWQSGAARARVWAHRPVWTHAHGTWFYFSRITIRGTSPYPSVTYARWSWSKRQWVLSQ